MPRNPLLTEGVAAHRFSAPRFYAIVVAFVALSVWAIRTSERFQNLFHGVSQARLSEALHRPVSFRTVEFRIFPPSVRLQDVVIGNDPRAGATPLLSAEEVSIGGGVSLVGQELRLGRIRAVRPRIDLEQFPDGSWNLPRLTGSSAEGGISVHLKDILVQEGVVDLAGRKIGIDGRLEDFAVELAAPGPDRLTGRVLARRGTLQLAGAEPLVFSLNARVSIDTRRGLTFDELVVNGDFGELRGTGAVEQFANPRVSFDVRARVAVREVERIFRSPLEFAGRADVRARIEIPPEGRFRITGTVAAAAIDAHGFPLQDVGATVVAEPQELVATIEHAVYQGGRAKGTFRIGNLVAKPQTFTLALEADGVSVERFFGDIDLPGTGFSGALTLSAALRWGQAGIEKADGGGAFSIHPGPAASLVKGRFGLPIGGGGPLSIVSGRIGFEAATFRFPQSTVDAAGGIRIGDWQPDFDLRIRSRDLSEMDRIFQNLTAASGGKPEPLGAGGTGEAWGHLAGKWAEPAASLQVTAEAARWGGVAFGSVRGTVGIEKGAFLFQPLRVYDADASFALEGSVRYRPERGLPKFDLVASARSYPLSRILKYLDFPYPVDGLVTGTFPLSGTPDALTGGGAVSLQAATVWGQKVSSLAGNVVFTPGHLALEEVRGTVGSGTVGGSGRIGIADKTFEAKLAGDGVRLEEIDAVALDPKQFAGKLSFQLTGHGTLDKPSLAISAALADARFFGRAVAEAEEPRLEAEVREGVLNGSVSAPGRWTLTARGDLSSAAPALEFALDASDVHSLLALTPLELAPSIRGTLATTGTVSFGDKNVGLGARLTVSRLQLDLPDHPSILALASPAAVAYQDGRVSLASCELTSDGATLRLSGSYDTKEKGSIDLTARGDLDARALDLVVADFGLTGKLIVDIAARGPVSAPSLTGGLRLEDGRYRPPGLTQIADQITGSARLDGSRADIEGVRAKIGGGDVYVSGSLALRGLAPGDLRLVIQGRRISFRYPQDMRLTADADLVVLSGSSGNQVRGEIVLLHGVYAKDFEITLASLLERRPAAALAARDSWKDRTSLEVRIVSASGLEVQNNVARLTASVELMARGTLAEPSFVGQVTAVEGGQVTFRNVRYEIESGTILFAGGKELAPVVDVRARAPNVSGYDIVVSVAGTWPRLQTTFTSDPPLADDVVLGMLLAGTSTGTSIASPGSVATPGAGSTTLVSAAGGVVADVLTSPISKGTQKLFRLDRFEIEPVFSGNQVDVRSTVGKQITQSLLVTYSQSVDTAKQPIINVEWRITDTITARALRDENGIIVIDIRRRLRL